MATAKSTFLQNLNPTNSNPLSKYKSSLPSSLQKPPTLSKPTPKQTYTLGTGTNRPIIKTPDTMKGAFANTKLSPDASYLMNKPVPSSPANTGANTSSLSPAGQQYASSLNQGGGFNNLSVEQATDRVSQAQGKTNTETSKQAYIDSVKAEQFPNAFQAERDARDKAAQEVARIQSEREKLELEARRAYEDTLDKPGGTVEAAKQAAQLVRRRSNTELADVALQENAALRSAQVAQGIFESAQGQDRQLTFEEVQALNDAGANLQFGSTISQAQASGIIPKSSTEAGSASSNASAQAYADLINSGQMKIENVPAEDRGLVAQMVELGTNTANTEISDYRAQAIGRMDTAIDSIMNSVSGWTTGFGSWLDVIPSSDSRNMKAELDTLKANIGFQELTAMRDASKTGGALGNVSDTEIRLLTNVLGALDTGQSPENFKKNLQIVKDGLKPFIEELSLIEQGGGGTGGDGLYDF
jgi:hypothetical protein